MPPSLVAVYWHLLSTQFTAWQLSVGLGQSPALLQGPLLVQPGIGLFVQTPLPEHESLVQGSKSLQFLPGPGRHVLLAQVSLTVHPLPSSQPAELAEPPHAPVLQMSLEVHTLPSSHGSVLATPLQVEPTHVSLLVQMLPSSQSTGFGP